MSERISDELCLIAAHSANDVFDERQQAASEEEYNNCTDEFLALQAIAGIRLTQPKMIEQDTQVTERLGMTVADLVEDLRIRSDIKVPVDDGVRIRVFNVMEREGYPSLRELLTMGYGNIKAMRNLGVKGLDFLERIRTAAVPDIVWSPHLDGRYAAQVYAGLDEIPARIIDSALHGTEKSIGSVKNLLGVEDAFLREHLKRGYVYASSKPETNIEITKKLEEIRRKAQNFVIEFERS